MKVMQKLLLLSCLIINLSDIHAEKIAVPENIQNFFTKEKIEERQNQHLKSLISTTNDYPKINSQNDEDYVDDNFDSSDDEDNQNNQNEIKVTAQRISSTNLYPEENKKGEEEDNISVISSSSSSPDLNSLDHLIKIIILGKINHQ